MIEKRERVNRNQKNSRKNKAEKIERLTIFKDSAMKQGKQASEDMRAAARQVHEENLQHRLRYDRVRKYLLDRNTPEDEINTLLGPAGTASEIPDDAVRALEDSFRPRPFVYPLGTEPKSMPSNGPPVPNGYAFDVVPEQGSRVMSAATTPPAWNPAALPYPIGPHSSVMPVPVAQAMSPQGQGRYMPPGQQYQIPVSTVGTPRSLDAAVALQNLGVPAQFSHFQPLTLSPVTTAALVQPQLAYSYGSLTFRPGPPSFSPQHSSPQYSNPQYSSQQLQQQQLQQMAMRPSLQPSLQPSPVSHSSSTTPENNFPMPTQLASDVAAIINPLNPYPDQILRPPGS